MFFSLAFIISVWDQVDSRLRNFLIVFDGYLIMVYWSKIILGKKNSLTIFLLFFCSGRCLLWHKMTLTKVNSLVYSLNILICWRKSIPLLNIFIIEIFKQNRLLRKSWIQNCNLFDHTQHKLWQIIGAKNIFQLQL